MRITDPDVWFLENENNRNDPNLLPFLENQAILNFKILRTAFMLVDPKIVKKVDNLTVLFKLSGSAGVKAVRRMMMKLTPGDPKRQQLCNLRL